MPTTVYFAGSITGGREDVALYRRLIEHLEREGHRVLAGAVATEAVGPGGEALAERAIFERDLGWIEEAAREGGVLVAEVSKPSTGVGYEIAAARYRHGMRVICLYRPAYTARCTAMVSGDRGIRMVRYDEDSIDAAMLELSRILGE